MHWFRFAVLVCIVTVLQAGFLANLDIKPDLLLTLLVFFAVYCNTTEAIITSFVLGFAADIIGYAMGPQTISFGLLGTALAYLHRVIAIRKMSYQALTIFLTCFLAGIVVHFLTFLKGRPTCSDMYAVLFWTSLCSAIVGPFLFSPYAWLMRMKINRFC
ncbi:MAG: rod shape-determining protein MreD [Planctomycetota bacterium]|nr:MAG: rod shape-determining protein MreD [Planctomycetota bacterium]